MRNRNLTVALSTALSLLLLIYFVIYALARPTFELVSAVLFEIGIFVFIVAYRLWRLKHPSKETKLIDDLSRDSKTFGRLNRLWHVGLQVTLSLCMLYTVLDLTALLLAENKQLHSSRSLYKAIAPPISTSIHPGFSLELLAGALTDAGKLDEAEPLKLTILKLREEMASGPHELIAGIYADLGDFYKRKGSVALAEDYYKRAITQSKQIHYPLGWGSPTTKLGTLYTQQGKLEEAETCFKEAIMVRKKIFGEKSTKVADTMIEYAKLLDRQGKPQDATDTRNSARAIYAASKVEGTSALPVIMAVVSLLLLIFRDRFITLARKALKVPT